MIDDDDLIPLLLVYSTVVKAVVRRAPSPANSFTSDNGGYRNVGSGTAVGAKAESNHYDDTLNLKPTRRAPPVPVKAPEKTEDREVKEKNAGKETHIPGYENAGKATRRAPPPKPVFVGEEENTSTSFSPSYKKEEEGQRMQLPPVSPAAVKLRPAPPTKPKSTEPPPPPTKPQKSGPLVPPTKPKFTEPPAPPAKPKQSDPPVPPTKPQLTGPPAPPNKPKLTGPPPPPTKPQTAPPAPTKPKPQVQPKPPGVAANDAPSTTSPGVAPKPRAKPRVPAKSQLAGLTADELEEDSSVPVSVGKFGEHVASLHADGNTGFSREFNVSRGDQRGKKGWGREE